VGRTLEEMSTEYEKELEIRNEVLASLLTKQNPGETVYIVDPKPEIVFGGYNVVMSEPQLRVFYSSLNEAFLAYTRYSNNDKITQGVWEDIMKNAVRLIDIYEYNIRTGAKTKVFG
jgi:hypothetical protein